MCYIYEINVLFGCSGKNFLKKKVFLPKLRSGAWIRALPICGVVIVPLLYKLLYFITFITFPYLNQYDTNS
ncbi:hypothetical protein DHC50_11250 [Arenibacter sp. A80]|nr:hypothetical protein [Arenibacter sp. A80]RFT55968.1 hypothetical protein D0S24_11240 [Arenibacter sp. P308M17]